MKREIERKRAAVQEEARQQEREQRKEALRQKEDKRTKAPQDPKIMAHKQAIEQRRMEIAKKAEQKRAEKDLVSHPPNLTYTN